MGRSSVRAVPFLLPFVWGAACGAPEGNVPEEAAGDARTEAEARADATTEPTLPEGAEALSLLGEPLYPPARAPEVQRDLEARLVEARSDLEASPDSPDAIIWVGRRTAYLGRYREAIAIYTEGIARRPDDPRFYRHRGHRYISVRDFGRAIEDLSRAAELVRGRPDEVEPDGLPNALGIPTSTLHSNIWYHLGLAHYLTGDFGRALDAYLEGMSVSTNPDMLVAMSHWLYMTYRRLGREAEAATVLEPITADLDVIENQSYHELLLLYKGERKPEDLLDPIEEATPSSSATAYGVGNWHLYNGRADEARQVFDRILAETDQWASFGYLAAEAEVARMEAG